MNVEQIVHPRRAPMTNTNQHHVPRPNRAHAVLRVIATCFAVLLLPPFIALAIAPMLLLLAPVALIGIPFIVPAMLTGSLAARSEERQRASWRPASRPLRVVI
jgi:hypothetical protein